MMSATELPPFFSKNFIRNLILILTAWISLSLWIASTINTPKKVKDIEVRTSEIEKNYFQLSGTMDIMSQDIRDIKNILMQDKK